MLQSSPAPQYFFLTFVLDKNFFCVTKLAILPSPFYLSPRSAAGLPISIWWLPGKTPFPKGAGALRNIIGLQIRKVFKKTAESS